MDSHLIRSHLETLRISQIAEWDVLTFIYRHGASLASTEQVGKLVGYSKAVVGAALDLLTSAGLILRSPASRGVRFYRFPAPVPGDARRVSLDALMEMAGERGGRLLIAASLAQARGDDRRERAGLHLARERARNRR